jgi:dTDP-4-dehydrorhamnose reductase
VDLILTTGLGGFLGSHVHTILRANHFEVENLPRDLRHSDQALQQRLSERRPRAIIHMAGIVDVRYCKQFPLEAFQAHVWDTARLLEATRCSCPETPFIYVATDKSFGEHAHSSDWRVWSDTGQGASPVPAVPENWDPIFPSSKSSQNLSPS